MLYIVATPIGNLSDITLRAIEVLKQCDLILCEDTRHSVVLLNHYGIKKPLKSFHKFSEASSEEAILADLKAGKTIALISDAGTPGIADPGTRLIQACIREGIEVVPIPGPCAAIQALVGSGLDTDMFRFIGFLPKQDGELRTILCDALNDHSTTICYESPKRIHDVVALIREIAPNRRIVIARELTKSFEQYIRGTAEEVVKQLAETEIKGEIVLLIEGASANEIQEWHQLSLPEQVEWIERTYQLSKQEALKFVAKSQGKSKRDLYNLLVQNRPIDT